MWACNQKSREKNFRSKSFRKKKVQQRSQTKEASMPFRLNRFARALLLVGQHSGSMYLK